MDRIDGLLTIDRDEEIELAFAGAQLGRIDVEIPDRIGLEPFLGRLVAIRLGQAADAVPLETTM